MSDFIITDITGKEYKLSKEYIGQNVEKDKSIYRLIAGDPDNPIAKAFIHIGENVIYLESIVVQPEHRGRGIGTSIMREIMGWGKPIILDILYDLPKNFYQRLGFVFDSPYSMFFDSHEQSDRDEVKSVLQEVSSPKSERGGVKP